MSIWENAFKINKGKELTEEEKLFLKKFSLKIKERKMETISVFILESTAPIHTILSNLLTFLKPTIGFIISKEEIEKLEKILENKKAIEFLKEELLKEDK
jgi:hypothetical protein